MPARKNMGQVKFAGNTLTPGTAGLPVSSVAAHAPKRAGGLPAEQAGGFVGQGVAGGDVPGAARRGTMRCGTGRPLAAAKALIICSTL